MGEKKALQVPREAACGFLVDLNAWRLFLKLADGLCRPAGHESRMRETRRATHLEERLNETVRASDIEDDIEVERDAAWGEVEK